VTETVAACHELGVPLVIEPVPYRRPNEAVGAHTEAYRGLVVGAVQQLQPLGVDLLKLPFPVPDMTSATEPAGLDACCEITEACRQTPWVLLGAGAGTDLFVEQIRIAGTAGAAGFLAGRGIWAAALDADPADTERIAGTVCRRDLERCRAVADEFAMPL
jgi:tagatose-1,6-bisphosphate aldolase